MRKLAPGSLGDHLFQAFIASSVYEASGKRISYIRVREECWLIMACFVCMIQVSQVRKSTVPIKVGAVARLTRGRLPVVVHNRPPLRARRRPALIQMQW